MKEAHVCLPGGICILHNLRGSGGNGATNVFSCFLYLRIFLRSPARLSLCIYIHTRYMLGCIFVGDAPDVRAPGICGLVARLTAVGLLLLMTV